MWRMVQQEKAGDFNVVATNETHSVRESWRRRSATPGWIGEAHVEIDPRYYRPAEVDLLMAIIARLAGNGVGTKNDVQRPGEINGGCRH